ncbi:MAG: DNA-directed RNA polymerase subunit beta [Bdellovibrionota bacterium]
MASEIKTNLRLRRSYSKIPEIAQVPNLIAVQVESYKNFLQEEVEPEKRKDEGLQKIFKSVFPIKDYNDTASLEFVSYELGKPKYDVKECEARGMTWSAPLKITVRLAMWDVNSENGERKLLSLKEDSVYCGEIPLMTDKGTFMINGTERVVVSQLHRSPGVFFANDEGKSHISGKLLYSARIIPYRGSWLDFEFDIKDICHVRIDRKRKLNATVILRALGMSADEILNFYYKKESIEFKDNGDVFKTFKADQLEGQKSFVEIKKGSKVLIRKGQKFNRANIRRLKEAGTTEIQIDPEDVYQMVSANTIIQAQEDVIHPDTGELIAGEDEILTNWTEIMERLGTLANELDETDLAEILDCFEVLVCAGEEFTQDKINAKGDIVEQGSLSYLIENGVSNLEVLYLDDNHIGDALWKTLVTDKMEPDRDDLYAKVTGQPVVDSLVEIYRRLRPGDPPRPETASATFRNLFFNPERYDLSNIGRYKMNHKLYISQGREAPSIEQGTLCESDIQETIRYLLELKNSNDLLSHSVDDIDHLGNRRVRAVGELVENQFRIGLVRMERAVKECMGTQDLINLVPQDIINYKPVAAVLREFFGSSQLSQFMDQTNPLSEITHKRRLSALGPGGLTRDRAGFEVRDVNTTHYGRICPIETPEGQNIGLIASLATFARVNDYGFLESPYRIVDENNRVTQDVVYLSALEEEREMIAQASVKLDKKGNFVDEQISCRGNQEYMVASREEITKVDVSPRQIVSVAASLIPFLENDDANRALMGSNMQRQAVPCMRNMAPLVGTGMEGIVARDSKATVEVKRAGEVMFVDADRIVVRADKLRGANDSGVDIYDLVKYRRSNQNTCINQRPIVRVGEKVKENEIIADGAATDMAELGLGQNVLVAFMPWCGYNYEDAILINENCVKKDIFTSIHVEEYECVARDTKLGKEEITRDIPNVSDEALKDLDETGIIRVGAVVKPGDILVGKITPKSETQLSPEEKLLRAIFGEKAGEVRDTSLKASPGVEGTVISTQVFSRRGTEKDERMLEIEKREIERLEKDMSDEVSIVIDTARKEIIDLVKGKKSELKIADKKTEYIAKNEVFSFENMRPLSFELLKSVQVDNDKVNEKVANIISGTSALIASKKADLDDKIRKVKEGDELAPGIIKMVKVYIVIKRKIQVGDKLAGRHGNKGVLSKVVPQEDMPYLEDGTPVDIVLNPLGVPSRMNIGQLLETHLGMACYSLGRRLEELLEKIEEPVSGRVRTDLSSAERKEVIGKMRNYLKGAFVNETSLDFDKISDEDIVTIAKRERVGVHVSTPVFDSAKEAEISDFLKFTGVDESGKITLYDGQTGEAFKEKVTVGVMYMLKLDHLVDNKIHARSIGPYSLVTQQPLGGKAQFGGQRLGEMEVWAMEAYGAAYALQEFLTVKSDDVTGRTRMYESIVKGEHILEPGLPESFNVMIKELQSLALNVQLLEDEQESDEVSDEDKGETVATDLSELGAELFDN